jgi:hypothetical protein
MRRIAAPMVGGMISAAILTLIVIPASTDQSRTIRARQNDAELVDCGPTGLQMELKP